MCGRRSPWCASWNCGLNGNKEPSLESHHPYCFQAKSVSADSPHRFAEANVPRFDRFVSADEQNRTNANSFDSIGDVPCRRQSKFSDRAISRGWQRRSWPPCEIDLGPASMERRPSFKPFSAISPFLQRSQELPIKT